MSEGQKENAERFNHNYVGTEHLLLGLIKLDVVTEALEMIRCRQPPGPASFAFIGSTKSGRRAGVERDFTNSERPPVPESPDHCSSGCSLSYCPEEAYFIELTD